MRPNFQNVDFRQVEGNKETFAQWEQENHNEKNWRTPEQIDVKPAYGRKDLEGMEHLNYAAGIAPELRPLQARRAWKACCRRRSSKRVWAR